MEKIKAGEPLGPGPALRGFSMSHGDILAGLESFEQFASIGPAAASNRIGIANTILSLFREIILPHHAQEEEHLLPAVVQKAAEGTQRYRIGEMVRRLTSEHRIIEGRWRALEPLMRQFAAGAGIEPSPESTEAMRELVNAYILHAAYEEFEFFPAAQEIFLRVDADGAGVPDHHLHAP